MKRSTVIQFASSLLLVSGFLLSPAVNAAVGKVIFAFGNVSVERPAPDVLTKGMPVEEGDTIVTGSNGYVQVLLDDATKIAIRPESRFVIDAVEAPAEGGFAAIGAGVTPRTQFSLQRGGFRTLTGRIASGRPAAYQVSTPNAVVGIRGTNYVARLCSGDCGAGTSDGLYVGVSDGAIFLSNNAGELDLFTNQFGYAATFNTQPVRLIAPPVSLQDEGLNLMLEEEEEESEDEGDTDTAQADAESEGEDSSEGDEGDAEEVASEFGGGDAEDVAESDTAGTDSGTVAAADAPDQEITAFTANGTPIDLTDGGSTPSQLFSFSTDAFALGTRAASESLELDDNGALVAFQALGASGSTETYDVGSAIPHNNGFDPESELRWGRWSEGIATVDGTDLDLTSTSLHYVLAPDQDAPSQVITGSAEYILVGNTDPTDNNGHIGILGDATLLANFTDATVTSNLEIGINGQVWQASGTGDITNNLFSGLYSTVTIDSSPGGSGSFGGFFSGFGDGIPIGAGMNYNLTNGSTTVNGAAVFNQIR